MKAFERIFLYSVLAVLVFYVFLVDGNVESQVAIHEDIRARRIAIVNDEGQIVAILCSNEDGNGIIGVCNKDGTTVAGMGASESGGRMEIDNDEGREVVLLSADSRTEGGGRVDVFNGDGTSAAQMCGGIYGGGIIINNKYGKISTLIVADKDGKGEIYVYNGAIVVTNKDGKVIGSLP
jgi:hypothetical protein